MNQGSASKKIVFEVGAKIEAQDFTHKWYPAKVCRVEPSERKYLIHFEGWNQRFDEWISFDSDKIRASTRSCDIKEAKTEKPQQKEVCDNYKDWKAGDRVLAKWIDGKYYPAKVTKKNDDSTMEVLFYDGFKKSVPKSHIKVDNRKTQTLPVSKDSLYARQERMERKSKLANARAERAQKRRKEVTDVLLTKRKERAKRHRLESEPTTPRESNASSPISDSISFDDDSRNISGSSSYTADDSEPKSLDTSLEDFNSSKISESTPKKQPNDESISLKDNTQTNMPSSPSAAFDKNIFNSQSTLDALELPSLETRGSPEIGISRITPTKLDVSDSMDLSKASKEQTEHVEQNSSKDLEKSEGHSKHELISSLDQEIVNETTGNIETKQNNTKNDNNTAETTTEVKSDNTDVPCNIEVISVQQKDIEAKVDIEDSSNVQNIQQSSKEVELQSTKQSAMNLKNSNDTKLKKTKISPKLHKRQKGATGPVGERKRVTRNRSTISPRGYGYSMAVMHPQVPKQESYAARAESKTVDSSQSSGSLDKIIDSLAEDSSIAEMKPVLEASKTETAQETNTPMVKSQDAPSKGKAKNFQAKKFRLDQITGKLSAQRQIEAEAAVQSPSAFHITKPPSPPPTQIPTPPPPHPPKVPSPKPSLGGHFPIDTNYNGPPPPPPLIYAPPPCCNNPHCQQHFRPPPRMTHPMHLPPSHLHTHSAGGYVMYPPGHTFDTRPPMPCSCNGCTAPIYHMHQDGQPHHESALARLIQVEQRLIRPQPAQHITHYREAQPPHPGPWVPHGRGLPHKAQYRPLTPKHEDMTWRTELPHGIKVTAHSPDIDATKTLRRLKPADHLPTSKTPIHDGTIKEMKTINEAPKTPAIPNKTDQTGVKQSDVTDEKTTKQELPTKPQEAVVAGMATPTTGSDTATGALTPSPNLGGRPRKGKEPAVAPKELVIDLDHNKYKCPIKDCDKSFRKESGLDYHIKYYHSPSGREIKRKRSSVSMRSDGTPDSSPDVSNPNAGKRRCHRSSAPGQLTTEPASADSVSNEEIMIDTLPATQEIDLDIDTTSELRYFGSTESIESVEEEVEPRDGDVVRCRCGLIEEGGFMIQCEQCLTWQHSECVGLTEQTVPSKYLCYVCSNPKGLRKRAKYKNDFDWFKKGTLSKFSFAKNRKENAEYDSQISLATHDLVADLHGASHVLKSLRVKIDILGSSNHPALGMWYKEDAPTSLEPPTPTTPQTPTTPTTQPKDYSTSLLMVKPLSNGMNKPSLTDHNQNGINSNDSSLMNGVVDVPPLTLSVTQATDSLSSVESEVVSPPPPLVPVGSTMSTTEVPETTPKPPKPPALERVESRSSVDSESSEMKTHLAMVNLLEDVSELQESLESRLDVIERQIEVLEQKCELKKDASSKPDLRKLVKDLSRIKRLALHVG